MEAIMLKKLLVVGVVGSLVCMSLPAFAKYNDYYDTLPYYKQNTQRSVNTYYVNKQRHQKNANYRYDDAYYENEPQSRKVKHGARSGGAPFPSQISGGNIVKVDLGKLAWAAYDGSGSLVKWGRASGGKSYCPDIGRGCRTVTGTYTIFSKKGPGCKSSRFPVGKGGAPMPYCMHFKGGYALHGGKVPNYNASHGCVRVPYGDAQWLNTNFVRVGSTRISIKY